MKKAYEWLAILSLVLPVIAAADGYREESKPGSKSCVDLSLEKTYRDASEAGFADLEIQGRSCKESWVIRTRNVSQYHSEKRSEATIVTRFK